MDPKKVGAVGGACAGKDEWDFMEPSYSFSCVLDLLKKQIGATGNLFSPIKTDNFLLGALVGNKRGEFFKYFRAHATPQFSFSTPDFEAPGALINSNVEGEKVTQECSSQSANRVLEGLDRTQVKGQNDVLAEPTANTGAVDKDGSALIAPKNEQESSNPSPAISK